MSEGAVDPHSRPLAPIGSEDYESGAERLLDEITAACESAVNFPQRLEAGLRATLELFAAEPRLGLLLTARPSDGDELALRRQERWQERFGDLLREAAAKSPGAHSQPSFVAPVLIAGIRWQISHRLLSDGGPERLEDLLPSLMEFVLACYLGPYDTSPRSLSRRGSPRPVPGRGGSRA
jgi:hypothetical protein